MIIYHLVVPPNDDQGYDKEWLIIWWYNQMEIILDRASGVRFRGRVAVQLMIRGRPLPDNPHSTPNVIIDVRYPICEYHTFMLEPPWLAFGGQCSSRKSTWSLCCQCVHEVVRLCNVPYQATLIYIIQVYYLHRYIMVFIYTCISIVLYITIVGILSTSTIYSVHLMLSSCWIDAWPRRSTTGLKPW